MSAFAPRKFAAVTLALGGVVAACFATTAWLLRFDLDRLLFAHTPPPVSLGAAAEAFRLSGHDGAAMIVRRFDSAEGSPRQGCVVFFPGHEGGGDRYASEFFPDLQKAGLVVYAVAYPGQDGAPGPARIDDVQSLAATAVSTVVATCGRNHTVVAGRSLGAMIAAYAAGAVSSAGLVMESASPSLSAGIRGALREHWFLRPLALLPIERIVKHDFSIAEALPAGLHVAIFQGSADTRTPLADFASEAAGPDRLPIFEVSGGTHADTLQRAKAGMISAMLGMIRGSDEASAAGMMDD
jgi:pimeloyl-ACP methyl ester carboxylesterase